MRKRTWVLTVESWNMAMRRLPKPQQIEIAGYLAADPERPIRIVITSKADASRLASNLTLFVNSWDNKD